MTRPVTPARVPKISTWLSAFCPVVASSVSSTVCGAVGSSFWMTRTIFSSSAISSSLFCSRPAVSMMSTSAPSAFASLQRVEGEAGGVGARLAGDDVRAGPLAPDLQLLDRGGAERVAGGEPRRSAPRPRSFAASLPMVVVLPVPLTPTTRMTCGFSVGVDDERLRDRRAAPSRSRRRARPSLRPSLISLSKRACAKRVGDRAPRCRRRDRRGSACPRTPRAPPRRASAW